MEDIISIEIDEYKYNHNYLPKNILGNQFYSRFDCKIVKQTDKFIRYKVFAIIERDYYTNNYDFFIVFNKIKNYYVLLNQFKYTVNNIEDRESDYSVIEQELLNIVLKRITGFIPYNYFDEDTRKALQKNQKFLNNKIYKLLKKYKNPFMEYSGCDDSNYYYDIYYNYQWIPEHIYEEMIYKDIYSLLEKLSQKEFIYNGKVYTFNNPLVYKTNCYSYNYKVHINNLRIIDIQ